MIYNFSIYGLMVAEGIVAGYQSGCHILARELQQAEQLAINALQNGVFGRLHNGAMEVQGFMLQHLHPLVAPILQMDLPHFCNGFF